MLGWDLYVFDTRHAWTHYAKLVFLHPVGSTGHVVHSSASRAQNVSTLFFMLGWARCGFHKNPAETCYAKLLFLHLVGSTNHVVHSGVSGAQKVNALFLMLGRARCSFHKKRIGTHYATLMFPHPVGSAGHVVYSSASGVQHIDTQKVCWDTLSQTCVFASCGICGSRSALWCIQGVKCRCAIFHAWVSPVRFL
jgi:hypothetical protein